MTDRRIPTRCGVEYRYGRARGEAQSRNGREGARAHPTPPPLAPPGRPAAAAAAGGREQRGPQRGGRRGPVAVTGGGLDACGWFRPFPAPARPPDVPAGAGLAPHGGRLLHSGGLHRCGSRPRLATRPHIRAVILSETGNVVACSSWHCLCTGTRAASKPDTAAQALRDGDAAMARREYSAAVR